VAAHVAKSDINLIGSGGAIVLLMIYASI